jgi:hypothetical protein
MLPHSDPQDEPQAKVKVNERPPHPDLIESLLPRGEKEQFGRKDTWLDFGAFP